jgi:hypothetical protein
MLVALGALTACTTINTGPVEPPKPKGIDGEWVDTRGVNTASFANGTFTSVALDTKQVMARGSYTYTDPSQTSVSLAFTSLLRNTSVNANCLLVMPSQMNCTTSSGAKFSLVRKGTAPSQAPVTAPVAANPNPPGVPADAVLVQ